MFFLYIIYIYLTEINYHNVNILISSSYVKKKKRNYKIKMFNLLISCLNVDFDLTYSHHCIFNKNNEISVTNFTITQYI